MNFLDKTKNRFLILFIPALVLLIQKIIFITGMIERESLLFDTSIIFVLILTIYLITLATIIFVYDNKKISKKFREKHNLDK